MSILNFLHWERSDPQGRKDMSIKDKKLFKFEDFINFAWENKKKYSLIENGQDLLVSTWYSDDLIEDYRNTL